MIVGITISEDNVYLKTDEMDNFEIIPFIICKSNVDDKFLIGKNAYEASLNNQCVLVDKLINMVLNNSNVTIGNTVYTANDLLDNYFKVLFEDYQDIEFINISLHDNNIMIFQIVESVMIKLYDKTKFKINTFSDSFANYVLSLNQRIYTNTVGLIEFTKKTLTYYELEVETYKNQTFVYVDKINHEPISVDLLSQNVKFIVCNNWLNEFAVEVTKNKTYSGFILTGESFFDTETYRDFINYICDLGCPVEQKENIFVIGSMLTAYKNTNTELNNNIYYITDSRTNAAVTMNVVIDQQQTNIKLVDFGEEWFYILNEFEIIVYDTNELVLFIEYLDGSKDKWVINLSEIINIRDDKTTKLYVSLYYKQYNLISLTLVDKGFGEFYEATNVNATREFRVRS